MKICSCGEVLYVQEGKDFFVCPKCNNVSHVIVKENKNKKKYLKPKK